MYCSAISKRLLLGMSTPMRRGILSSRSFRLFEWREWTDRRASAALTLLVTRVGADDPHDASTPHDLALGADAANAASDFHFDVSRFRRSPRQMIRPLVKSYGDISTVILSPGR